MHEDRFTKDVPHRERAFGLLAGHGPGEVQREGCGHRVGDDLLPTVVTDEDCRAAWLLAWSDVQRCLHCPGLHLAHDQFHSSELAKHHALEHEPSS